MSTNWMMTQKGSNKKSTKWNQIISEQYVHLINLCLMRKCRILSYFWMAKFISAWKLLFESMSVILGGRLHRDGGMSESICGNPHKKSRPIQTREGRVDDWKEGVRWIWNFLCNLILHQGVKISLLWMRYILQFWISNWSSEGWDLCSYRGS